MSRSSRAGPFSTSTDFFMVGFSDTESSVPLDRRARRAGAETGEGRRDVLDLSRLRALHAVHLHGSVGKAAQALGYTPSAVSQQVAKLERETGTALLERAGRGIALTDDALMLVRGPRRRCSASSNRPRSRWSSARGTPPVSCGSRPSPAAPAG